MLVHALIRKTKKDCVNISGNFIFWVKKYVLGGAL